MNGDKDIADLLFDKYDMLRIRTTIYYTLLNTRCSCYVITPTDVSIAVDYLKSGKGDGFEGLCSDHFIKGTKNVYVFYLLYSLFLKS